MGAATFRALGILAATVLLPTASSLAISNGQQDTFDTGTTLDWSGGQTDPAQQVATNGAGGASDGYLQIATTDFHLGARNSVQWAGDYLDAGITGIEMDLKLFGPDDADIRLLLLGPGGTWATTARFSPTNGGGWEHAVFSLAAADMTYVPGSTVVTDGTGVLNDTLAGVTDLLIRHDSATPTIPGLHPPYITSTLGIDNITAAPEPATLALLTVGAAALVRRRRRR